MAKSSGSSARTPAIACAPVLDSTPGSSQRSGAPSTVERSERLGWPPSPGNSGPSCAMKVACRPSPGEVRLRVELGQGGRVGRAHGVLRGSGDLQAAGTQFRTDVVDRDVARAQRVDEAAESVVLDGRGQGRPAAVGRHGRGDRVVSSGMEPARRRRPAGGRCIRSPTRPRRRGRRPRPAPTIRSSWNGERARTGAARTRRGRTRRRRRTDTAVLTAGSTAAGWLRRAGLAPEGVVGRPPLDGVDEAPALLEGACGGAGLESLAPDHPGGVDEAEVHAREPGLAAASPHGPLLHRLSHRRASERIASVGLGVGASLRKRSTPTTEPTIPRNSLRVVVGHRLEVRSTARSSAAALEPVRASASSYSGTRAHFGMVDDSTSTWNWTPQAHGPTRRAWTAQWSFPASTPRPGGPTTCGPVPLQAEQTCGEVGRRPGRPGPRA